MTTGISAISLEGALIFTQGCISAFLLAAGLFFLLRRGDRLKRMLGWILLFWFGLHMKDLLLLDSASPDYDYLQQLCMSIDMLAVPTCAFLLLELAHPGWLTWRRAILHEAPFLCIAALYWTWPVQIVFTINIVAALLYSLSVIFHLFRAIPEYNRMLSENYSYTDTIDLEWLWKLLIFFIFFIVVWAYACIRLSADADILYNLASCGLWGVICYYIDRQEAPLLDKPESASETEEMTGNERKPAFAEELERLFAEERLWLNPRLTINDVAQALGTNRTYLSDYLNHWLGTTFYEYVNAYRIRAVAEQLAQPSCTLTIEAVAESCGFNSVSTFRRVFIRRYGCTPNQYKLNPQRGN